MANWARATAIFLLFFGIYWGTAVWGEATQTPDTAYFNELADAFLRGRLYLIVPASTHDLTAFQGKWYVPFPPLPALLLMPWVAISGKTGVNTVLFATICGAANVTLIFLMLQALAARRWSQLQTNDNLWLTLLFGLGCVHWYMATIGSVWFVAQICTVTFVALAVWIAVARGSAWLAGAALALAMLARPNVALTWPLLLGIAAMHVSDANSRVNWRRWLRWGVVSALPMILVVAGLLGYNAARFGNPLDFGYLTENVADKLRHDLHTYGQFHLRYLPKNLYAMLLAIPRWDGSTLQPDGEGMSLLITTPALIFLLRSQPRSPFVSGAWMALLLLTVPLLLYYNTGWWQFGYRFSLDFMVPVMVLLAISAREWVSWPMRSLILLGILVNGWGVTWWHG